ncbi:hypothetical protein B0O99DRAFT_619182 [Bisporella sp. PMI_857]|nr:hypothetical protein B0O99DRAFT_619182 [Bisporella sp. PMI_857]
MFTTLRYNKDAALVERVDSLHMDVTCQRCRSKKIKCTRDKGGCRTCLQRNYECVYSRQLERKDAKKRGCALKTPKARTKNVLAAASVQKSALELATSTQKGLHTPEGSEDSTPSTPELCNQNTLPQILSDSYQGLDQTTNHNSLNDYPYDFFEPSLSGEGGVLTVGDITCVTSPNWDPNYFHLESVNLNEYTSQILGGGQVTPGVAESTPISASEDDIAHLLSSKELTTGLIKPTKCLCADKTLRAIEKIATAETQVDFKNVPECINFNKLALAQCRKFLDCLSCTSISHFMMLLIILYDKLASSYDKILALLTMQYNKLHPDDVYVPTEEWRQKHREIWKSNEVVCGYEQGVLLLRDYDVDAEEEACIFGGVVSMQVKSLQKLVVRSKAILQSSSLAAHIIMVEGIEKSIRKQLDVCGYCTR